MGKLIFHGFLLIKKILFPAGNHVLERLKHEDWGLKTSLG